MSSNANNLCNECKIQVNSKSDANNEEHDVKYDDEHKKHPNIRWDHLWAYLIHSENVPNLQKLVVRFAFSILVSNTFCESIFGHMKFLSNNYRNNMKHDLVSAELTVKMSSQYNCIGFYNYFLNNQHLLQQVRLSNKYTLIAKMPRTGKLIIYCS
jgi:hypothetical protein